MVLAVVLVLGCWRAVKDLREYTVESAVRGHHELPLPSRLRYKNDYTCTKHVTVKTQSKSGA